VIAPAPTLPHLFWHDLTTTHEYQIRSSKRQRSQDRFLSKIFGFSSDHIANRWAFASLKLGLIRVSFEEVFTTEAQSSQSSENFLIKNSFTLRPEPALSGVEGRLRGAISEPCITSKPKTSKLESMFVED